MKAGELLRLVEKLVEGPRAATHGDKRENHENIAALWSAYLGISISPFQVALMMVLLKVARTQAGQPNLDDYVDMAGYAAIAGELSPVSEEQPRVP
jgi:hypothetical protein